MQCKSANVSETPEGLFSSTFEQSFTHILMSERALRKECPLTILYKRYKFFQKNIYTLFPNDFCILKCGMVTSVNTSLTISYPIF